MITKSKKIVVRRLEILLVNTMYTVKIEIMGMGLQFLGKMSIKERQK